MSEADLYCILLALAGCACLYWGKRRNFMRLNRVGFEEFPSYSRKLVAKLADGGLISLGYGLIGGAALILVVEYAFAWLVMAMIFYVAFKLDDEWYGRRR